MSMNDTPGGGGGYGDGSARAYGTGDGGAGGMGGRRSHARSASHGGIMITHQPHLDQGKLEAYA